jgi:hypothetical protein
MIGKPVPFALQAFLEVVDKCSADLALHLDFHLGELTVVG